MSPSSRFERTIDDGRFEFHVLGHLYRYASGRGDRLAGVCEACLIENGATNSVVWFSGEGDVDGRAIAPWSKTHLLPV